MRAGRIRQTPMASVLHSEEPARPYKVLICRACCNRFSSSTGKPNLPARFPLNKELLNNLVKVNKEIR